MFSGSATWETRRSVSKFNIEIKSRSVWNTTDDTTVRKDMVIRRTRNRWIRGWETRRKKQPPWFTFNKVADAPWESKDFGDFTQAELDAIDSVLGQHVSTWQHYSGTFHISESEKELLFKGAPRFEPKHG